MTREQLQKFCPAAVPYESGLQETFTRYGINTPLREAMFLAQISHESGGFKFTVENLNYSAKALRGIFGKYFTNDATAEAYARNPQKIANRVYANRMSNGDEASGDGWKFRGRGLIQLTGKANTKAFSLSYYNDERLVADPSTIATNPLAVVSAGWYWDSRKLNPIADTGDIEKVTRAINGGLNGIVDRKMWYEKAKQILATPAVHGFGYPRGGDIPTGNI